jgi:hypothetical protein
MPVTAEELQEYLAKAARDEIDDADFAGPHRSFPCDTQAHVDAAAKLVGHADNPEEVKRNIIRIAKRHGFSIPDSWKDDKAEESTATIARPAKKIATLPICWLEYNARSLNGRIYPQATCDAIFRAAQKKIADLNASDPPTTFVSHEDANHNVNTHLVGGPTKVWQEGSKFWANIDMADTSVARDMVALIEGRYLRSGSIRVLGVELRHDRNSDLPLVMIPEGVEPVFQGIDLTTRPGLVDTARIPQVIYEQSSQLPFVESFNFEVRPLEKETPMPIPLYLQILTEAMTPDREAHGRIHDHLAGVLDETVAAVHAQESARLRAGVTLSEEGRALAMKHATRLAAAHDESARAMGMTCEGAYNETLNIAPSDTDQDGDDPAHGNDPDNDGESAKGGNNLMTEQEALALLASKGYSVAPPKTTEDELKELRQLLESQQAELTALKGSNTPPQRQTFALQSMMESGPTYTAEAMYSDGELLRGSVHPKTWWGLAGHGTAQLRDVPWPKDADPWAVVHEMAPIVAFGICEQQAAAVNSHVSMYIGQDEEV